VEKYLSHQDDSQIPGQIKASFNSEAFLMAHDFVMKLSSLQVKPDKKYKTGTLSEESVSGIKTENFILHFNTAEKC
jgi:hypothetical protein